MEMKRLKDRREGIQSPQDFKRKGKGQGIGDLLSTDAQQSRGKEASFTINAQIQMPLTSLVLFLSHGNNTTYKRTNPPPIALSLSLLVFMRRQCSLHISSLTSS